MSRILGNGCSNILRISGLDKAVSGLGSADEGSTELVQQLGLFCIARTPVRSLCVWK